jgi:hypothetical protein
MNYIKPDLTELGRLGTGKMKTAYKVINATSENASFFETDIPIDKLVIVCIKNINLDKLNKTIKNIVDELEIQHKYSINDPQLAPKLYLVTLQFQHENKQKYNYKNIEINDFIENSISIINDLKNELTKMNVSIKGVFNLYILEELCGPTPTKKVQPLLVIDDNFFFKVNELIDNLIKKDNLLFTDFKPQNTCPEYDSSGNLTNIMGLDLDVNFTYKLSDLHIEASEEITEYINKQIELPMEKVFDFAKNYMFIQFYYMLLTYGDNLTNSDRIFIKNKINNILPPEKLIYQMTILLYLCYYHITELKSYYKGKKNVVLENISTYYPILYYTFPDRGKDIINNLDKFKTILYDAYKEIGSKFYIDSSYKELVRFIDPKDIITSPEKISIEELNALPIVSSFLENKQEDQEEDEKQIEKPIAEVKPISTTANYDIDSHEREHMEDMKAMYNGYGGKKRMNKSRKIKRY